MNKTPVIAIFDVGKTNKKLLLFDESYELVHEKSVKLQEDLDEDGFPCEDLELLKNWILNSLEEIISNSAFRIKAVNFSAYGASLVYLDEKGNFVGKLYNYLKPYPENIKSQFYKSFGGEENITVTTASPGLGSLNSGLQIYRIKYEQPDLFEKITYALHLPQFLSYLLTGECFSEITSVGCHTHLWDFTKRAYHEWVEIEGIKSKLAPIVPSYFVLSSTRNIVVGVGLHDSSAALIPYLINFKEPFLLISTGTWSITLNPFNTSHLTSDEISNDCLCYLNYKINPVKASRLFAGFEHDQQVQRIASHFYKDPQFYNDVVFDPEIIQRLQKPNQLVEKKDAQVKTAFGYRNLSEFASAEIAYHQLMIDIMNQQFASTNLVLSSQIKRIFVDGGFSNNSIYMNLLASYFPELEVYAASIPQSTALGAALAIHKSWNPHPIPADLIHLKLFSVAKSTSHRL
jgi:sugar (pentulose or hexulose) kinase